MRHGACCGTGDRAQRASALDIAVRRFKAIELSIEEGNWTNARWLELIPASTVGARDKADPRDARDREAAGPGDSRAANRAPR